MSGADPTAALVGRTRERAQLRAALADAADGHGSLWLVTGEPGIGKTRLVRAVADEARGRGAATLWGAGWDGGGAPAYWPWIQIVRALAAQRDIGELGDELGAAATQITSLLPELRAALGHPPAPPELDPDQARFHLFDAVALLLAAAARRGPLLVVLDDLHWADTASAMALEFVARELSGIGVVALATYREEDARRRNDLAPALGGLARAGRRLSLAGLDRAELELLIGRRGGDGRRPAPQLVARLHEVTGGNPFFADELIRLLEAQGRLDDAGVAAGPLPLPVGVREAIMRRLAPFEEQTLQVLAIAAVVGTEFRVDTLGTALDRPPQSVLETLDEPVRLGLLLAGADPGHFAFAHALVRETLLDNLGPRRRAELHAAVGRTLERRYAADLEPHLAELAHHFLQAGAQGDVERAIGYGERAAQRALALAAYEEAARLYAAALQAAERAPTDDARRGRLAQCLGEARMRAGDVAGARVALDGAAGTARRLDDARSFARAVLARSMRVLSPGVVEDDLVALLHEAIERIDVQRAGGGEPEDDELRVRLGVQLAMALYWSPSRPRRLALVDEAVALARTLCDDPAADRVVARRALAHALGQGFMAVWCADLLERGLSNSAEALELCESTGDSELALQVLTWRIHLLFEAGDLRAAYAGVDAFSALVARLGQPRTLAQEPLLRAVRALLEGDFGGAERLTTRGAQLAAGVAGSLGELIAGAQSIHRLRWTGGVADVLALMAHFADALPALPLWRHLLAVALVETGRVEEARAEYERLVAADLADLPQDNLWLAGACVTAELAASFGDARRGRLVGELLAPYDGRNAVATVVLGPVARYLGLAALAAGEHDLALAHLGRARAAMEAGGARPQLALLALDEARVLAARGGPDDRRRAAALAGQAVLAAQALGMAYVEGEAERLRAGTRDPAAPAGGSSSLRLDGDVWTFAHAGRTLRLSDAKGLRYLATLLAAPGTAVRATVLEQRPEGDAERARVNVQRAIRAATRRIAHHDLELARLLEATVRTGLTCAYEPDPVAPLLWEVRG